MSDQNNSHVSEDVMVAGKLLAIRIICGFDLAHPFFKQFPHSLTAECKNAFVSLTVKTIIEQQEAVINGGNSSEIPTNFGSDNVVQIVDNAELAVRTAAMPYIIAASTHPSSMLDQKICVGTEQSPQNVKPGLREGILIAFRAFAEESANHLFDRLPHHVQYPIGGDLYPVAGVVCLANVLAGELLTL